MSEIGTQTTRRDRSFNAETDSLSEEYKSEVHTVVNEALKEIINDESVSAESRQILQENSAYITEVLANKLLELQLILRLPNIPLLYIEKDPNVKEAMAYGFDRDKDTQEVTNQQIIINLKMLLKLASSNNPDAHGPYSKQSQYSIFIGTLAEELFHYYTHLHYPGSVEKAVVANSLTDTGETSKYNRDRAEIAAKLFKINYLLNAPESNPELKECNEVVARYMKDDLEKRLGVAEQRSKEDNSLASRISQLFSTVRKAFAR